MKVGERIRVIDGKGRGWEAALSLVNEKETLAELISAIDFGAQKKYSLHIAIAPTKNMDRIEWFAEKATELGIDEISLIICKNSERKIIKSDRIRKICESAVKQSMQAFIPQVNEAVTFEKFILSQKNSPSKKLIAHCEEQKKKPITEEISSGNNFLILVGPEGDFDEREISLALENNFIPVSLGESRLRTETAGVYAAAALRSSK
jgi:16S rRNA (uracil1498-N3)-methyltransferase